jgi:cyclic beta-1,2-glucan synthetase
VQHWWHPPSGAACARDLDDLLWLPFVTAFYINVTGDVRVGRGVPFLEQPCSADQHENYTQPQCREESRRSTNTARAHRSQSGRRQARIAVDGRRRLERRHESCRHGGKGESVWLGWFLYTTLALSRRTSMHANRRARQSLSQASRESAQSTRRKAWDGDWYRRAYFDDGTPLGSARNEECRIDSIAQSWSVISGASDPYRMGRAMARLKSI